MNGIYFVPFVETPSIPKQYRMALVIGASMFFLYQTTNISNYCISVFMSHYFISIYVIQRYLASKLGFLPHHIEFVLPVSIDCCDKKKTKKKRPKKKRRSDVPPGSIKLPSTKQPNLDVREISRYCSRIYYLMLIYGLKR